MLTFIIEKSILAVVVFGAMMGGIAYATLFERKFASFFQDRIGPNRTLPFGILQPLADGVKFFMKEDAIPINVNRAIFILAPVFIFAPGLITIAVVPFGPDLIIGGYRIHLQVADVNIGLLFIFAISSLAVYGTMIGGWASNNKYSLMGGIRASSQMISYEISMGLSVIGLIMVTGSLSLKEIVLMQSGFKWLVFYQPLGFLIFLVSAFAETSRTPFDLPEAEAELVGGYHTEYGSMKFGLFQLGEYGHMIMASALMTTIYFGGWQVPFINLGDYPSVFQTLIGIGAFCAKVGFFVFLFMWVRWTVPRFRYDQLMRLGWKVLLPLALLNIFLTGLIMLLI